MNLLFYSISLILFSTAQAAPQITEVAVTIDDLPIHGAAPDRYSRYDIAHALLEVFSQYQMPATYGFINARGVKAHPKGLDILKLWNWYGHPLGNHTYSHPDLRKMTLEGFLNDIEKNETILSELAQESDFDFKYFRYPFLLEGETQKKRDGIREFLFKKGYKLAHVTIDYQDYGWNAAVSRCLDRRDYSKLNWLRRAYVRAAIDNLKFSQEFSQRIFGRQIRHILLAHIGISTALFFEDVVKAYRRMGVKFVELPRALEDEAYAFNTNVISSHGPNFLDQMAHVKKVPYPPTPRAPWQQLAQFCR